MKFGDRIRQLRLEHKLTLRRLAEEVGVTFTYLSKVENQRLSFGDFPRDELIIRLANALHADADELLLLAEKIPESMRQRLLDRPDAFRKLASLSDERLNQLLEYVDAQFIDDVGHGQR